MGSIGKWIIRPLDKKKIRKIRSGYLLTNKFTSDENILTDYHIITDVSSEPKQREIYTTRMSGHRLCPK